MSEDEVVLEVRAVREAFAASHGYDIRAMVAALHEWGIASGREVVRLAPRPVATAGPNLSQDLPRQERTLPAGFKGDIAQFPG